MLLPNLNSFANANLRAGLALLIHIGRGRGRTDHCGSDCPEGDRQARQTRSAGKRKYRGHGFEVIADNRWRGITGAVTVPA